MKKLRIAVAAILLLGGHAVALSEDAHPGDLWSFVQVAQSGGLDGTTLTLRGVPVNMTAFTERPDRRIASIPTEAFIDRLWHAAADSFAEDPPNAAIGFEADGAFANAVVELREPRYDGGDIRYAIRVIEGEIPKAFGNAIMIIDNYQPPGPYGSGYSGPE